MTDKIEISLTPAQATAVFYAVYDQAMDAYLKCTRRSDEDTALMYYSLGNDLHRTIVHEMRNMCDNWETYYNLLHTRSQVAVRHIKLISSSDKKA